jgi:DNA-binding MarR family transcriptional regulator
MPNSRKHGGPPVAFLLAQIGFSSSRQFAKALEPLKLAPCDAGILRQLGRVPGISQQELAHRLEMHASRLVALIDTLEKRSLVVRQVNSHDRRQYSLHLTEAGQQTLAEIGQIAQRHNQAICAGLSEEESSQLAALLEKLASLHGLKPEIHPGYRDMGKPHAEIKSK